eukprot:2486181-Pleurochrysis_carterae.AAC.9
MGRGRAPVHSETARVWCSCRGSRPARPLRPTTKPFSNHSTAAKTTRQGRAGFGYGTAPSRSSRGEVALDRVPCALH